MAFVEKTIDVEVPVRTAYNQWTQFEEFPQFMEGTREVTQLDDTRLHWVAEIGGRRKEWYAKIVDQVPDYLLAWTSEGGVETGGEVAFEAIGDAKTRIRLRMEYEPESVIEGIGDLLGFVSRRVDGDLKRFKEFIEARGVETGAWRGSIQGGQRVSG
jgi:uncharacterized membrane protein